LGHLDAIGDLPREALGHFERHAVTLDRDVTTGSGPETITIHNLPMPALAPTINYTIVGSPTGNGLPTDAAYNYAWVGVAEYYLHAYGTPTLATEGVSGGAAAVVYVVQGSAIKGRFTVPDYMAIDIASVVRVNMFLRLTATGDVPVYQFLPDIRIADYSGIRSVADRTWAGFWKTCPDCAGLPAGALSPGPCSWLSSLCSAAAMPPMARLSWPWLPPKRRIF